jgi:hypothetical protein
MHGEFHWHKHDEQDEFFFVLDGLFRIDSTALTRSNSALAKPSPSPKGCSTAPSCHNAPL